MHLNCPNCQAAIEVIHEESVAFLTCSSCGSRIRPSSEVTETLQPKVRQKIDEYELVEYLGGGTFGDVWKAYDPGLKTHVAIKVPRERNFAHPAKELFLREARIMATLSHPHIVRVLRVIDRPDETAIVMEFINGSTLAGRLENFPFESPRAAVEFWEVVVRAVHHAHEAGVVHRDLKPANILLNERREPLVTDFGLAKQNSAELTVTGSNAVVGNFAHMAPEQAAGKSSDADRRSDVYSLGSILYQLLAHRPPFVGETRTLSDLKQHDDPHPPSHYNRQVSRDLDTICLKALQREPAQRYATAGELADDLRRYREGHPILARRTPPWERGWRWMQRNRAQASLATVTLLLAGLLVINHFTAAPPPPPEPVYVPPQPPPAPDARRQVQILVLQRLADESGQLEPLRDPASGRRPSSARVKFWFRDPQTGEIDSVRSPDVVTTGSEGLASARLHPGDYFVVAEIPGHGFHEVERRVPTPTENRQPTYRYGRWVEQEANVIELAQVDVPPTAAVIKDMIAYEEAHEFYAGSEDVSNAPRHLRKLQPFFLDATEVTIDEWNGYLVATQRPPLPESSLPITGISFERARDFAEWRGKRLQTEFEFEFAATNGGKTRFPWPESTALPEQGTWELVPVKTLLFDRNAKGVQGLLTNAGEFTSSWLASYRRTPESEFNEDQLAADYRVERGTPSGTPGTADALRDPTRTVRRIGLRLRQSSPRTGIRCSRSLAAPL